MTDDGVRLDEPAELLDFRITDGETRWLNAGAAPIEGLSDGVIRVRVGSWREPRWRTGEAAHRDSWLEVLVPEVDLDSETTHQIRVEFFTGTSPLVLISGETTLPRTTLGWIVDEAIDAVQGSDWRTGRYIKLAEQIEYLGLGILRTRIKKVEALVRQALADPEFSDEDLDALARYADRLAAVESSARVLRGTWPEMKTARPPSGTLADFGPISAVPDAYGRLAAEIERDAKDAVARLSGLISSQQIVLTQRQARDATRFQRLLTIVGATVLVPGLVAAVFGADVGFHGDDTTSSFWALLLLMVGSGVVTYALFRSFEVGAWGFMGDWRPVRWAAGWDPTKRIVVLALVGVAVLIAGGTVLFAGPPSPPASGSKSAAENSETGKTTTSTAAKKKPSSSKKSKSPGTSSRKEDP